MYELKKNLKGIYE